MIGNIAIWKALLAHKTLIVAATAAVALIIYATPIADVIDGTAFAAKGGGGGGKPPNPPGGGDDDDQGEDEDGDYGHTVKSPKPHK
jgi:hypothetical protein